MTISLYQKDLVSVDSLSVGEIDLVFEEAKEMEKLVKEKGGDDRLSGKILAALFFEPSTRTFSSFITAMQRLGGGIIPMNGMKNTSIDKGESFEHTVKVFSNYADILVIRHPEFGMPRIASEYAGVPVINAGDGIGEHPTQALLDVYTITDHFKSSKDLVVTLVGDLKNGRTVHSLSKLIAKMGIVGKFNFVSPPVLTMPVDIKKSIVAQKAQIIETESMESAILGSDVIYMTRVQKERFEDQKEYDRLKSYYQLTQQMLSKTKKDALVMHPLPIAAGEINHQVDNDPRSVYLTKQLRNGLSVRMALLHLILNK